MADLERTYTIPLRSEWLKTPRHRRAKKATKALREFLQKHMKTDDVKIGKHLNEKLWKHGIKNPPCKVKVTVIKKDDIAKAELFGNKYEEEIKAEEVKEDAKGLDKVKDMLAGKEKEVTEELPDKEVRSPETSEVSEEDKIKKAIEGNKETKPVEEKKPEVKAEKKPETTPKKEAPAEKPKVKETPKPVEKPSEAPKQA
jgi:large subunit ribosomal protein L31e